MRKRILLFAAVLMLLPSAMTVQAHGHHGQGHHNAAKKTGRCITYSQCTVAKCRKNRKHWHKGKCYYGHATGGKRYSQCTVAKCRKNGKHKHNGKCYYGHSTIKK